MTGNKNKAYLRAILAASVLIPTVVAILLFTPIDLGMGKWVKMLPGLNALINTSTSVLLLGALLAVRKKNITLHRNLMLSAIALGAVFLISYVLYHSNSESTVFGDSDHDGLLSASELESVRNLRSAYLFILLSHIAFSIVVVPFVLISAFFSLTNQIEKHRKVVRISYPVWMYVSITGVVVYLMVSPYY